MCRYVRGCTFTQWFQVLKVSLWHEAVRMALGGRGNVSSILAKEDSGSILGGARQRRAEQSRSLGTNELSIMAGWLAGCRLAD